MKKTYYRLLNVGEVIREGDEAYGGGREWYFADECFQKKLTHFHTLFRRPLATFKDAKPKEKT